MKGGTVKARAVRWVRLRSGNDLRKWTALRIVDFLRKQGIQHVQAASRLMDKEGWLVVVSQQEYDRACELMEEAPVAR